MVGGRLVLVMAQLVGIDPSFSRSGLCVLDTAEGVVGYTSISVPDVLKVGSIYQFSGSFVSAQWHALECVSWLESLGVGGFDAFFIEYPALSSPMGAWLLPLQCMLYSALGESCYGDVPFYLIPPTAINSLVLPKKPKLKKGEIPAVPWVKPTKEAAKKLIVEWVQSRYGVICNHDEASAVVLAHIGELILGGSSAVKFQLVNRDYVFDGRRRSRSR